MTKKQRITVKYNKRPQQISLPAKAEYGQIGIWWINGWGEFTYGNIVFRHYCLEKLKSINARPTGTSKEGAFNAMVMLVNNRWKGILLTDDGYYRKGWTKTRMAKIVLAVIDK